MPDATAIPEHFELTGKRALVVGVDNPAGAAIARRSSRLTL